MGYLAGFDVGSSSTKGTLLDSQTGRVVATYTSPQSELRIYAPQTGWAEQNPETWWTHVREVSGRLLDGRDSKDVEGIGISYQMHGLVIVDKAGKVLRPAIIWCDGRTQDMADRAAQELGPEFMESALNYPGNFTASKLAWVKQNEPETYARIHKAMLPGDYIAMRLTGETCTTPSGLSEGIMWDFQGRDVLHPVLQYYGIGPALLPDVKPTFSVQGEVNGRAANATGFAKGTPVAYRAGDQPNNAFSLKVLNPGEMAATAGTSGVVYAVTDQNAFDPQSRVNVFGHVNGRNGILACISGAGCANRWMRDATAGDYASMNRMAAKVAPGSDGVIVFPYGNGPERTLGGKYTGFCIEDVDLNRHGNGHLSRAVQEGVVYAIRKGTDIMANMGAPVRSVRAGKANMFKSGVFGDIFANAVGAEVELMDTDGSQGAARGAGVGIGTYATPEEAFVGLKPVRTISPNPAVQQRYGELYSEWSDRLQRKLQ